MRNAEICRKTAETDICLYLNLDSFGNNEIDTGCGFLDHMLTLFACHGNFSLKVKCNGDTQVDDHHTVEDIGICLGQAFCKALGDKKGIFRYGSMMLPMDESLVLSAVDFSGRSMLVFDAELPAGKVGSFDTELCEEFWLAFVREAACTLHIRKLDGRNTHHIIEAIFKSVARSLKAAVKKDPDAMDLVPSTKGVL